MSSTPSTIRPAGQYRSRSNCGANVRMRKYEPSPTRIRPAIIPPAPGRSEPRPRSARRAARRASRAARRPSGPESPRQPDPAGGEPPAPGAARPGDELGWAAGSTGPVGPVAGAGEPVPGTPPAGGPTGPGTGSPGGDQPVEPAAPPPTPTGSSGTTIAMTM